MRGEANGLGIDRDYGTKVQAIGKVVAILVDRSIGHELGAAHWVLVPRKRLELSRPCGHRNLKPARLPIPPPGQPTPPLPDHATDAEKREARDVALAGDGVNR